MKIEKVNEQQIRCTLTREDLANRELKISELAYGTEKAKNLFRDMMRQASFECGFEAEDIPLMIEAIPLNSECIVLIITKVEDPEELDTRFSKFSPLSDELAPSLSHLASELLEGAGDLSRLFGDSFASALSDNSLQEESQEASASMRIYSFDSLDQVSEAAQVVSGLYDGINKK